MPIRIGVNGGSLDPDLYEKHGGKVTPEAMVESAQIELAYFDEVGFDDVKISVKASSVPLMIEAYRQLADVTDHPLHLGVTEAGPLPGGLIKATAGIATLLAEGIGDTIRYSLTADPVEEARAGRQLLEAMGLRERKNVDLIACPRCGRAEIDVIEVAAEAQAAFDRPGDPPAGGGDGLRGQRARRGPRRRPRHRRRARTRATCSSRARTSPWSPRTRWSARWSSGPSTSSSTASRPPSTGSTPPRPPGRPRRTAPRLLGEQGDDANHDGSGSR